MISDLMQQIISSDECQFRMMILTVIAIMLLAMALNLSMLISKASKELLEKDIEIKHLDGVIEDLRTHNKQMHDILNKLPNEEFDINCKCPDCTNGKV